MSDVGGLMSLSRFLDKPVFEVAHLLDKNLAAGAIAERRSQGWTNCRACGGSVMWFMTCDCGVRAERPMPGQAELLDGLEAMALVRRRLAPDL